MWSRIVTNLSLLKSMWLQGVSGYEGDGREQHLLKYVLERSKRGDAQSVIKAIDEFVARGTFLMNIGTQKGEILDSSVKNKDPSLVIELGTFCGYSAIRIASNLRADAKLVSLELMPHLAEVAKKIIDHAGLSSKVEVLLAPLSTRIEDLKSIVAKENREGFDFVFIDHDKEYYLSDYLELKKNELIREGGTVFTDNLGFPGAPDYMKYLQSHPQELETEYIKASLEYISWIPDTIAISTFHKL